VNSLRLIMVVITSLSLWACTAEPDDPGQNEVPSAGLNKERLIDLIVHNGHILTFDESLPVASAMAVNGDQIVAIGGADLIDRYRAASTVDLEGRTTMPGFIDSHTHIRGNPPHYIDLTEVTSVAQISALLKLKAAEVGPASWITGYGWSEDELDEQRRPTIADLDQAAPGHPIMLTRAGGHSAVFSSAAFELAGIDATTANPEGGTIERDESGQLNGIIRERQRMVGRLIPVTPKEDLRASLTLNLQALFASGITSIVQASDFIDHYPEWEAIYSENRGELPRASVQVAFEGSERMAAFGRTTGDGDKHLRVGAIKIFADGGFTGPAAYTSKPYKGEDEYRGELNMSEAKLETLILDAHRAGWQLGIHAIGDAAIELTVAYLTAALNATPRPDHRHYLNHFTTMPGDETMAAMAAHGIAITQQPNFTYTLEGRYVANLDGKRLETNNPLRTPMDHGIHVAISSDILPIGPMTGIYAAVTRKGMSGRIFGAQEKLSRIEALQAYTLKGAYLTREEQQKGSLTPGKLADFIVLSADPLTVADADLLSIEVLQTYLGGKLVYRKAP
jgi:predicted amidohydrolase YtcJ